MDSGSLTPALRETIECFDGEGTPLTTTEVAERLDLGRRSTYERLDRLADQGCVETKKVGASARVWWRPRGAAEPDDGEQSADEEGGPGEGESEGTDRAAGGGTEMEHPIESFESLHERITDGFFALDEEGRFTYLNERAEELLGQDAEALHGRNVWEAFPRGVGTRFHGEYRAAMESGESSTFEAYYPPFDAWIRVWGYPSETGLSVYFRDVTDRKEREQELERYETIVEEVDDGVYTVDREGRFTMVNDAFAEMTGYDREELLGSHVSKVVGEDTVETASDYEQELVEGRRQTAKFQAELQRADGDAFPAEASFAILPASDTPESENPDYERVGVVRDVTERVERERKLARQRERLTALNDLNAVFRNVTEAVIDKSTRDEIEDVVCERLAASDSYLFAWIGEVTMPEQTVRARTAAGVDDYLDEATITVDPDDERSRGPTGRAFIEQELQATQDVLEDDDYEVWRDAVDEYGFRSSVAIPVADGETLYGVLNVYSARPGAFGETERAVLGQLGEVVGHAIAAVQRELALTSDEVVELEFQIGDLFEMLDVSATAAGAITLDSSVPVGEDVFLVYGSATGGGFQTVEAMVESADLPHWDAVEVVESAGEATAFQVRLTEPPVLSQISDSGGYVHEARIEDGDYYMRIHLAPSTDVRTVVDTIQETYRGLELVSRRQRSRTGVDSASLERAYAEELTDRQRTALEAAYHRGYFDWSRSTTGEEIASSLGVSASTFHQHLRRAQAKLFDATFGEEPSVGSGESDS